jgi:hypothetical protein
VAVIDVPQRLVVHVFIEQLIRRIEHEVETPP